MTEHNFGGAWTEIKLTVLKKYLNFYTKALKNMGFKLYYIDAFAGTGDRIENIPAAPIFGKEESKKIYSGSAQIALSTEPLFDAYLFIEKDKERVAELEGLVQRFDGKRVVKIKQDDANIVIQEMCAQPQWYNKPIRGVIFLDPYGLQVEWSTLEAIAKTKALDVWFLFPLSGVNRQASLDHEKMESYKKKRLTRMFGTGDWENYFYKTKTENDLFGSTEKTERINIQEIENWVTKRLKDCFPYVSKPLPLPSTGSQFFSLFFCVSNPDGKAIGLATKAANHILKHL
ncbi:three-Cys-motif partner protein TcmP [Candidatus Venteria ishoeyi]|uniref:Ribosomal RNA large subunit methyltransferase J n=1 Tax=Candidatus Venteria ishoeyi TaxID=1899563 RepID=A0A1H6F6X3_9GAMM|nr:three-Cys-motif partner protein TcmP [Candidatus Venteria ishoeyi]SEH04735.1 Ribosomal RNA large subunit methyltransferase J [Candidatus Venteria ishoeyi]